MVPTIYATEPWSPSSEAIVAWGSLKGGVPPEAAERRMVRLVEVAGAVTLLEDQYHALATTQRYDELCNLLLERVAQRKRACDPYVYRHDV
jgi:hypothetical protein